VLRRLFNLLAWTLLLLVVAVLSVLLIGLQKQPLVTKFTPPTSVEVIEARAFVQRLRQVIGSEADGAQLFVTDASEMNSVIKLGARIFPGFRGTVETTPSGVHVEASLPLVFGGIGRWVNLSGKIPAFDGAVGLTDLRYGAVPLPGGLLLGVMRRVANTVVNEGFGDVVLGSARSMSLAGEDMVFTMQMDGVGNNGILRGLFGSMRGTDMPESDAIIRYYVLIREAMDRGTLPVEGSYLPYIRFTLEAALEGSQEEGIANAFTAAIFGLSYVCGAQDFGLIVGGPKDQQDIFSDESWKTDCRKVTLNDRIDSRRHFTTAAAIQSASNRGFAVSVGEFKELYDSVNSGGFDFTDLAANNSGIRLANTMMAASAEAWPGLIDQIQAEKDVIIAFEDIPQIMTEIDFETRYGDVESPEYLAQLAAIEAKIDVLPLHQ